MAKLIFSVAVTSLLVTKITFVVADIIFKVAIITSSVVMITCVVAEITFKVDVITYLKGPLGMRHFQCCQF